MTTSTRNKRNPVKLVALAATSALLACASGRASAGAPRLQSGVGPYQIEVLTEGRPAREFFHRGESYVLGRQGERYTLRVWNRSARRIEAVVSVDGRDVVDGRPGDFVSKRGYLVAPGGYVDIEGWRLSEAEVAAFRFTNVDDSYAGRLGSARHVGVIGLAVFPERHVPPRPPVLPWPRGGHWPTDREEERQAQESGEAAPSRRAPSASAEPSAAPVEDSARAGKSKGAKAQAERDRGRPGLGTAFGENVHAPVQSVFFVRAEPRHPAAVLGVRYNDRRGLVAMGVNLHPRRWSMEDPELRRSANPFPAASGPFARPPVGWRGR